MPRIRYSLRAMMIAVAVSAVGIAGERGLFEVAVAGARVGGEVGWRHALAALGLVHVVLIVYGIVVVRAYTRYRRREMDRRSKVRERD